MTAYCNPDAPQTPLNFAYENHATLLFPRLKDFSFKVVSFNLPEVSLAPIIRNTPFVPDKVPGETLNFGQLEVKFIISEDFGNWIDMFGWMQGLGFPSSHEQYEEKQFHREDLVLAVLNAYQQPVQRFVFEQAWPTYLSGVQWNAQSQAATPLTATVTFNYTLFRY